jgi:hypothetical protein
MSTTDPTPEEAKAKASPKRAPAKGSKSADRDEKGRLRKGHNLPGPGRPALPDELTKAGPAALRRLVAMAERRKGYKVCDELWFKANDRIATLVYGKDGKTRVKGSEGDISKLSKEQRIELLEDLLLMQALAGDRDANFKLLAALDPERYGGVKKEPDDPDANDTLDVEPLILGEDGQPVKLSS